MRFCRAWTGIAEPMPRYIEGWAGVAAGGSVQAVLDTHTGLIVHTWYPEEVTCEDRNRLDEVLIAFRSAKLATMQRQDIVAGVLP